MRRFLSRLLSLPLLVIALVAALVAGFITFEPRSAEAQTPNFGVSMPNLVVLPFHISGQYTANQTAVVRFKLPFPAALLSVQANARASGGTSPTLTVDVMEAGVTVLSAPIAITAGTVAFGTVTDAALADEGEITVNFAIGGTSPTWNDITIVLVLFRT